MKTISYATKTFMPVVKAPRDKCRGSKPNQPIDLLYLTDSLSPALQGRFAMGAGFWLSDCAWVVIELLLPRNQPGARWVDDWRVISGITPVLRVGCRCCRRPDTGRCLRGPGATLGIFSMQTYPQVCGFSELRLLQLYSLLNKLDRIITNVFHM